MSLETETTLEPISPEAKFEEMLTKEFGRPVEFAATRLPFCIRGGRGTIGFINGPAVFHDGILGIPGRVIQPGPGWQEAREVKSDCELVEVPQNAPVAGLKEEYDELPHHPFIRNPKAGASYEDFRVTPFSKNNPADPDKCAVCGVEYEGLKEVDGQKVHSLGLVLGLWNLETERAIDITHTNLKGYKNGVILGPADEKGQMGMLCRSMDETRQIKVAKTEGDLEKWEVQGNLPGFWENFPAELKDKVERIGPGTNPLDLRQELGGYVMGFHWVMRGPDALKTGEQAEYYIGGMMLLDSLENPHVLALDPFAISPMDADEDCLKQNLFEENKHVVFPVGAARTGDEIMIFTGFNDNHEHAAKIPIKTLEERLKKE